MTGGGLNPAVLPLHTPSAALSAHAQTCSLSKKAKHQSPLAGIPPLVTLARAPFQTRFLSRARERSQSSDDVWPPLLARSFSLHSLGCTHNLSLPVFLSSVSAAHTILLLSFILSFLRSLLRSLVLTLSPLAVSPPKTRKQLSPSVLRPPPPRSPAPLR